MTAPWTPTGDKRPQMAMVMVDPSISAEPDNEGRPCVYVKTDQSWWWHRMPICCLHPMPPAITPEQEAVIEAAAVQESTAGRPHSKNEIDLAICKTHQVVRAMLAAQRPTDPVAEVKAAIKAMRALISLYERDTCQHENTHRGGRLWTICDDCGRKWADDEGGFKPYSEPAEIVNARAAIAALEAKS